MRSRLANDIGRGVGLSQGLAQEVQQQTETVVIPREWRPRGLVPPHIAKALIRLAIDGLPVDLERREFFAPQHYARFLSNIQGVLLFISGASRFNSEYRYLIIYINKHLLRIRACGNCALRIILLKKDESCSEFSELFWECLTCSMLPVSMPSPMFR